MRSQKPYCGPFSGGFSIAATVVVVVCTIATIAFLFGGRLSELATHDRGLSHVFASRLEFFNSQFDLSRPTSDCVPHKSTPSSTLVANQEESLPLLDIEQIWGDSVHWGDWKMQRYWDEEALKNSIRASDPAQLYPLIKKLQNNESIVVVGIGSSLVSDFGGLFHRDLEVIYKLVPSPSHKFYQNGNDLALTAPSNVVHNGWIELFMQYVNHTWPHPDHLLINAAKPGHVPENFADGSCLELMLPSRADLILIETMGVGNAAGLERLSWRILRHFTKQKQAERPAIVYFNTIDVAPWPEDGKLQWAAGAECGGRGGLPPGSNLTMCCKNFTSGGIEASFTVDGNRHKGDGAHHELARLYGFGSISHRDFLWPFIKAKAWEWLTPLEYGECGYLLLTNGDSIHPSPLGQVLFADYFWTYLNLGKVAYDRLQNAAHTLKSTTQETTLDQDSTPIDELIDAQWKKGKLPLLDSLFGEKLAPLPQKPFTLDGRNIYSTRCYGLLETERSPLYQNLSGKNRDTEDESTEGENTNGKNSGSMPIVDSKGFEFHENTTHGLVVKRKPGWIAMNVGDFMEIVLDTYFEEINEAMSQRSSSSKQEINEDGGGSSSTPLLGDAEIVLTYLKSYEHMGKARITCMRGCMCVETEVDAHHEDKTSVSQLYAVPVTQSKECILRIQVIEGTSSGEHKFKITQVAIRMKLPQEKSAKPSE